MTESIPSETIDYERYVDRLRRANAKMLTALKDIVLWAERHGLTKADLITGGQAEVPVITNARAAIVEAEGEAPLNHLAEPQEGDTVVNHLGESPQIVGSFSMPTEIARELVRDGHARVLHRGAAGSAVKTIGIHVEGGMVQNVNGIPAGYELRVEDYDVPNPGDDSRDGEKKCVVSVYG